MSRLSPRAFPVLIAVPLLISLQWRPTSLVDAASSPGLLEWVLPIVLRVLEGLPVGTLLSWTNALIAFLAVASLARVMYTASASYVASLATLIAFVATPAFDRSLAPAAGLAAVAAGSYAWRQLLLADRPVPRGPRRVVRAAIAALAVPLLVPAFVTSYRFLSIADIGPLPFGLAALGAFSVLPRIATRVVVVITLAAISIVAPVAAFWCLVSVGLGTLMSAIGTDGSRAAVATGIAVLVALLQVQRLSFRERPASPSIYGHERLTSRMMFQTLRAMPEATIVAEDAATDLVIRAANTERRIGKRVRVVPRRTMEVTEALKAGPVFAMPRAQSELQHRGFELKPVVPVLSGLAQIQSGKGCVVPGAAWSTAEPLSSARAFALVADDDDARGPVLVYVGSDEEARPVAREWNRRHLRGFQVTEYVRDRRPDLRDALIADGIPPSSELLTTPYVTRVTVWRTPGAPRILVVLLRQTPRVALARLGEEAINGRLELCPSLAYEVAGF